MIKKVRRMIPEGVCPVCGSLCAKPFCHRQRNATYLRCTSCQSLFLDPKPTAADLQAFYNDRYYDNCSPGMGLKAKRDTYTFLADRVARERGGGSVLEIGAGTGFFMDLLCERGLCVYGTEFSEAAWKLNPYAEKGMLAREMHMLPADMRFSSAVLLDVIEHLPDPAAFLEELRLHLVSDARVYMVTPDRTSFSGRIMGSHWPHIAAPEHIHLLSRKGLRSLAERSGYRLMECAPFPKRISLHYAKEMLKRYSKLKVDALVLRFLCSLMPESVVKRNWKMFTGQMLAVIQVRPSGQ